MSRTQQRRRGEAWRAARAADGYGPSVQTAQTPRPGAVEPDDIIDADFVEVNDTGFDSLRGDDEVVLRASPVSRQMTPVEERLGSALADRMRAASMDEILMIGGGALVAYGIYRALKS